MIKLKRLQYQCEFNETNPCFNASANVLYTEQARELAQSGGIDDVALEEMSEAEKQAELAKREAEKASQAFQKWVRCYFIFYLINRKVRCKLKLKARLKA